MSSMSPGATTHGMRPVVIPVRNLIDPAATSALRSSVTALLTLVEHPRIVLDISGVDRLNADAVSALLWCWQRCREAAGQLSLTGIQEDTRVLLRLARLHLAFPEVSHD